jgi:hypothetical protein
MKTEREDMKHTNFPRDFQLRIFALYGFHYYYCHDLWVTIDEVWFGEWIIIIIIIDGAVLSP